MFSVLVVVPTLDSYLILPRLVRSLESQTFTNWRVLFVDGKSSITHKEWLREQCRKDSRFCWEDETDSGRGIFAAMNQGFKHASKEDWLVFWGSDDIAADKDSFKHVEARIMLIANPPDLYICGGRYFSVNGPAEDPELDVNRFSRYIHRKTFRNSLFWGSTPPHQATFLGPGARSLVAQYNSSYKLSGDLDYFLRLSLAGDISIYVDELVLVLMGDSGISRKQNQQRLSEVIRSYRQSFGYLWLFPFTMRYIQRFWSIIYRR